MDELLELLARDHDRVMLELSHHARKLLRAHLWRGDAFAGCGDGEELMLPGGRTAEDLVLDIFQKVLVGTRKWKKEKYPELMPVLKRMIESEVSNCFSGDENQTTTIVSANNDGDKDFDFEEGLGANHQRLNHATRLLPPDSRFERLGATGSEDLEKCVNELFKDVAGDEKLQDVVSAIMGGAMNAREAAAETGIKIERVYELNRKLDCIAETITKRVALQRLVIKAQSKGGS